MYVFRYVMCVFRHVLFVWILSLQPPHEENAIAVLLRIRTINMDSMQRTIEQKKKKKLIETFIHHLSRRGHGTISVWAMDRRKGRKVCPDTDRKPGHLGQVTLAIKWK